MGNKEPLTFIFMGRSGCGKGTQAQLLQDYIRKHDTSGREMFYLETGEKFRSFIASETYSSAIAGQINKEGGLQPEFLAVWIWADLFVQNLKGGQHVILDGTPRKLDEARVLDSAFNFYKFSKPIVIFLDVSREFSETHMRERARDDDKLEEVIKKRLDWYETDALPAVRYYWKNPNYTLIQIQGEQPIEKVHQDIIRLSGLDSYFE